MIRWTFRATRSLIQFTIRTPFWRLSTPVARRAGRKVWRSGMQIFWRTSITPTSGSRWRKARCIYMPRRFFTSRTFPSCSPRRLLGYGGSPMVPELVHRTRQVLPKVKLVQVYGLSEAGFLTGLKDDEHTEDKLTSCGRPCMGIDVRVVDATGKEVETGKTGEMVARGANIMRSYWNKPEETKLAFRNGFFRTGDVGYQDANGYFYILDRLKDMIVTGGENVYSGEVEAVIYTHPAVREVAVFGIPDPKWGEIVK